MAWLKGVRTDGFIKIDENVNFRGTVVGTGDGHMRPYGALDYYVDGTDGKDSYSGKSWEGAFKTIQKAITTQIADTKSKGDVIWIAPGIYAETLTGNLTKVQIIGTTTGCGNPHAVSIRPTDGYSYTGQMTDAAFRNIMFMSPSSDNKTYPAVLLTYMGYSTIDNCSFIGKDSTCIEGLQLGATADGTTQVKCDYSAITNNLFTSFYGVDKTFSYAIKIGTATGANGATRQMSHTLIANNMISARTTGIWLGCAANTAYGTVIRDNFIGYSHAGEGCASYGIGALATGGYMYRLFIVRNYIHAETDGIYGFDDSCTFDNYISLDAAAPVAELPVRT